MTHPSGRGCRQQQETKSKLLRQIAEAEFELRRAQKAAVQAGLKQNVRECGKHTARCVELNQRIFKLTCEIDPVVSV